MSIEDTPIKQEGGGEKTPSEEAVEFVEKHRDFFEYYAGGAVKFLPAPEGLNTFAFDLNTNSIYVSPRFFTDKGYSDKKTVFAVLHELEHFFEKKQILMEKGGAEIFAKYLKKIKESSAYSITDSCVADVRENNALIQKTNESYKETEHEMYTKDLFPETGFIAEPKHIQFGQALLRESKVPDEECVVVPEVREKINELKAIVSPKGARLWDVMTNPNTPMSVRLKLQDKYVMPMMEKLKKKDLEEEKEKRKKQKEEGEKSKQENDGEKSEPTPSERGLPPILGERSEEDETLDPEDVFKDAYKRAKDRMPEAVPIETIEKAFEDWKAEQAENKSDPDKEYAEKIGVKKEDLQRYRQIVESLEKIINPETNENIIEDLSHLIERIIAKRLKPKHAPKYPEPEGEDLVDPAQLVADAKAGNFEAKAWETLEVKQMPGQKFGEVEITLVCDRSGSMETPMTKLLEQRKSAVFLMEALKNFAERCDEEAVNMEKPLEVRSEIYAFSATNADKTSLKKMSKELGEKERIEVMSKISSAPGRNTTDYVCLETILADIDGNAEQKIKEGELKKIVIVFTDGDSGDKERVKTALKNLREKGVVAVGVGVTESGAATLETYAPDARLAEQAEKLSIILADLLKEHLQNV
jgi:flagellin-specific chaperone FliS